MATKLDIPFLENLEKKHTSPSLSMEKNIFHCKHCNKACSGLVSFQQHEKGRRHKAVLRRLNMYPNTTPGKNSFYCQVCDVDCSSPENYIQHVDGKRHKRLKHRFDAKLSTIQEEEAEKKRLKNEIQELSSLLPSQEVTVPKDEFHLIHTQEKENKKEKVEIKETRKGELEICKEFTTPSEPSQYSVITQMLAIIESHNDLKKRNTILEKQMSKLVAINKRLVKDNKLLTAQIVHDMGMENKE